MKVVLIDAQKNIVIVLAKQKCVIKGLRDSLQKQFHMQGIYGLECNFIEETAGLYNFHISSPYSKDFVEDRLRIFHI